jgi:hypothetical protein
VFPAESVDSLLSALLRKSFGDCSIELLLLLVLLPTDEDDGEDDKETSAPGSRGHRAAAGESL